MDIQRLRRETEADHLAVEGALTLTVNGLETAQYVQCLRRIYGVVAAWDEHAVKTAPDRLRIFLTGRQRKHLLEQDLCWFGVTDFDNRRPVLPDTRELPSFLGVMYVMEGSSLGGQLIAKQVEASLHLNNGHGNAYFRGYGHRTGSMWKEFRNVLETEVPDDQTDLAVTAAKAMFKTFGAWMREKSAMDV